MLDVCPDTHEREREYDSGAWFAGWRERSRVIIRIRGLGLTVTEPLFD